MELSRHRRLNALYSSLRVSKVHITLRGARLAPFYCIVMIGVLLISSKITFANRIKQEPTLFDNRTHIK